MITWPILSVVTFLPTLGALLVLLIRGEDEAARRNIFWISLWTTLVTFVVTVPDVTVLNIGAAFWGLVAGLVVSLLLERPDFAGRPTA